MEKIDRAQTLIEKTEVLAVEIDVEIDKSRKY
jgi:hypothetical protein